MSDQVGIGFSFASDWLRVWREFSRPITEHSKAKPMQSRITFDTQVKIALYSLANLWYLYVLYMCLWKCFVLK